MPRATCRCGQKLSIPINGPERVICPKCSARIRVRRSASEEGGAGQPADGFVRFSCSCGRRLKVRVIPGGPPPQAGRCPDCGRIVPVPTAVGSGSGSLTLKSYGPETPTEDMNVVEQAEIDRWARRFQPVPAAEVSTASASVPFLTGPRSPNGQAGLPYPSDHDAPLPLPGPDNAPLPALPSEPPPAPIKSEAGLRICGRCGRPLHLSATTCRECGAPAPKR